MHVLETSQSAVYDPGVSVVVDPSRLPPKIGDFCRGRLRDLETIAPGAGWSVAYHEVPNIRADGRTTRPATATATVFIYPRERDVAPASMMMREAVRVADSEFRWVGRADRQFAIGSVLSANALTGRSGAVAVACIGDHLLKIRVSASTSDVAADHATMIMRALLPEYDDQPPCCGARH